MGKLDIAILILIGLGSWGCFHAGFTRSVWGIAAIAAGFFAASQLWRELSPIVGRVIHHEGAAKWTSIIAIAVGVLIAVDLIFDRIQSVMERGVLGWVNNIVGAVFGAVSSGILLGFAFMLLDNYGGQTFQDAIHNSRFAPTLLDCANQVFDFGQEVVREQIEKL
jgi:uncharacterized membrane protein required for colicin V production